MSSPTDSTAKGKESPQVLETDQAKKGEADDAVASSKKASSNNSTSDWWQTTATTTGFTRVFAKIFGNDREIAAESGSMMMDESHSISFKAVSNNKGGIVGDDDVRMRSRGSPAEQKQDDHDDDDDRKPAANNDNAALMHYESDRASDQDDLISASINALLQRKDETDPGRRQLGLSKKKMAKTTRESLDVPKYSRKEEQQPSVKVAEGQPSSVAGRAEDTAEKSARLDDVMLLTIVPDASEKQRQKKQVASNDFTMQNDDSVDPRGDVLASTKKKKTKKSPSAKRGKSKTPKFKLKRKLPRGTRLSWDAQQREEWEAKRNQIVRAADLVAHALHLGPWPSPYRSLDPSAIEKRHNARSLDDDDDDVMTKHTAHMSMVGASIEQFVQDVIVPTVREEIARSQSPSASTDIKRRRDSDISVAEGLRVFLGTLLMIRELFVLNAMSIFGPSGMITGREADFGSTLDDDIQNDLVTDDEAAIFSVRILATTIILTGLADLGDKASEELTTAFLNVVAKYE